MVEAIDIFIALLNEILASICLAILSATNFESSSGLFISKILICTSFEVSFFNSSLSLSTSDPALPIITPGLAVFIVIVINFKVRSIIILEILAFCSLTFKCTF